MGSRVRAARPSEEVELESNQTGTYNFLGVIVETGDWDNDGEDDLYLGSRTGFGASGGYILSGPLSAWDTTIENAPTYHDDKAGGVGFGDLNGDGWADLAAAGWMDSSTYGAVWFGPLTGALDSSTADLSWDRPSCSTFLYDFYKHEGEDAQLGDLNGDGQDDLIVGSTSHNIDCYSTAEVGAVYVTYGPITASPSLSNADLTMIGDGAETTYGYWPAVLEDMDGDGIDDLASGSVELAAQTALGASGAAD